MSLVVQTYLIICDDELHQTFVKITFIELLTWCVFHCACTGSGGKFGS
jgi:hypothetical protein